MAIGLFILMLICGLLNLYCGVLFMDIYRQNLTGTSSPITLKKLKGALVRAKTPEQAKLVRTCRKWYVVDLIIFYIAVAATISLLIRITS
ncbi:MAG TPA: hypothetical protein VKR32_16260 [Puia sp.]|nr:hypothetical protein [Puia sp.]